MIGRVKEQNTLKEAYKSEYSQFVYNTTVI